MINFMKIRSAK